MKEPEHTPAIDRTGAALEPIAPGTTTQGRCSLVPAPLFTARAFPTAPGIGFRSLTSSREMSPPIWQAPGCPRARDGGPKPVPISLSASLSLGGDRKDDVQGTH